MNNWFINLSVQLFLPLILIYRRDNFVYHHWGCTWIYRPLAYPWLLYIIICYWFVLILFNYLFINMTELLHLSVITFSWILESLILIICLALKFLSPAWIGRFLKKRTDKESNPIFTEMVPPSVRLSDSSYSSFLCLSSLFINSFIFSADTHLYV